MNGEVSGAVRTILRLEGLAVLAAAAIMYERSGFGWATFALFFLVPDVSLLGYFAGRRVGAFTYNMAHAYVGALVSFAAGLALAAPTLEVAGLIWSAHIGFDRAMGYGLKYAAGFGFTHLGRIGRSANAAAAAAASGVSA